MLGSIRIIHLYGKLSGSPLDGEGPNSYTYNPDEHWRLLRHDIDSIRVIDEQRVDLGVPFKSAYGAMLEAEQICFLGFGFDETNMNRLRLGDVLLKRYGAYRQQPDTQSPPTLCATVMGLESAEQQALIVNPATALLRNGPGPDSSILAHYCERVEHQLIQHAGCKSTQLLRRSGALM